MRETELEGLAPGDVLEAHVVLSGVVLSRRAHSASVTFLDLDLTAECRSQLPAELVPWLRSSVQLCVNAKTRLTGEGYARHLALLGVGDTIEARAHPGRTRTGSAGAEAGRPELSFFPASLALRRVGREPSRALAVFDAVRSGAWSTDEAGGLLGCEPSLVPSLLPSLAPALDALERSRARPAAAAAAAAAEGGPAAPLPRTARLDLLRRVAARRQAGLVLIMEGVTRPTNAAAMLRSCDAFGVSEAAIVYPEGAPRLSDDPQALRHASASADLWVELSEFRSTADCLSWLRGRGLFSVGTALRAGRECESLWSAPSLGRPRLAVWVGSEARGLSEEALEGMDALLTVPMDGMVESLNVACCATVVLAEVARRRADAVEAEPSRAAEFRVRGEEEEACLDRLMKGNGRLLQAGA